MFCVREGNRILARFSNIIHIPMPCRPVRYVTFSLDPVMMSISSAELRYFSPPSHCNNVNEALQCMGLGLLQEDVENGWRPYATFANSDICLKPFKCVIIAGYDPAGALVVCRGIQYTQEHTINHSHENIFFDVKANVSTLFRTSMCPYKIHLTKIDSNRWHCSE